MKHLYQKIKSKAGRSLMAFLFVTALIGYDHQAIAQCIPTGAFCHSNNGLNSNNDAASIEYDNAVSAYHQTVVKNADGSFSVWGENMAATGAGHLLSPKIINSTNYPALTGTPLLATVASMGDWSSVNPTTIGGQLVVLTTTGLFAGGILNMAITGSSAVNSDFQKITVNGKADGLPAGVSSSQVKMLFASYRTVAIVTCSGSVYVLAGNATASGNGGVGGSWAQVLTAPSTPLTNIVVCRGVADNLVALKSDGTMWTWGTTTYLGNGTGVSARNYATQMTLPAGVTVKMIGMSWNGSYYLLATNGTLYTMGYNVYKALGDFTAIERTSWIIPQKNAAGTALFTDVAWVSPSEHDINATSANVITTSGTLYCFGFNGLYMIGGAALGKVDPQIPQGVTAADKILLVETGGHTSMLIKQCAPNFGYVGHRINGSMGNGSAVTAQESTYTFATPAVSICGAPAIDVATTPTLTAYRTGSTVTLTGSPAGGLITLLSGPATVSGTTLTITGPGNIQVKYDATTPCGTALSTTITIPGIEYKFNPDFNATSVNVPVTGTLDTNDVNKMTGTTYGTPVTDPSLPANPAACMPTITDAATGAYSFTCATPGVYHYLVPTCEPSPSTTCVNVPLTITVLSTTPASNGPVANTDIATTTVATAVTLKTLANDASGNSSTTLNPASITVPAAGATGGPQHGTVSINTTTGDITYTPAAGFTGTDTYNYTVCDNASPTPKCTQSQQTVTIYPASASNTTYAADDYAKTIINTPVSGNVATNDEPGGTVTFTSVPGGASTGTITTSPTGTYTFTPATGFSGPVDIPYTTCDAGTPQACATATLHILVTPAAPVILPPVAQNINNAPINNSAAQTHIGALQATDPQGAAITGYTVSTLPLAAEGVLYTCSNNTVPCTGTFAAVTAGQVLTPAQADALYFDPAASFMGNSTFTYTATSVNGTSNTATVHIPVVNNAPTANSFTTGTVPMNSPGSHIPALTGADADGIVVSYTVTPPSPAEGTLTYCTAPPSGGCGTPISTATVLTPAQAAAINFIPATGYTGNTGFTFITTDNNGNTSTPATVTIPVTPTGTNPANLPPATQNITNSPVNSNAGNSPIAPLLGSDPDGSVTTYTISTIPAPATGILYYCTTGNYPCTGTLTAVITGQSLSPAQATTLQFDPADGNNNPAVFTYTATDNGGLVSNTSTVTVPVSNNPPVATSVQQTIPFNATNSPVPALIGNDADGTVTGYTITTIPNAGTQGTLYTCSNNTSPCTGSYSAVTASQNLTPAQAATLTFTPVMGYTGSANAGYTATDNNGNVSATAGILLNVASVTVTGVPPVATGSTTTVGANAGSTALAGTFINGTDVDGSIASYSILDLPPASQGIYTYCVTPPSTGCGTALATGILTPAQAASLSFTPNPAYKGPATLSFTITDNAGNTGNMSSSTVNVTSQPPIANGYTTAPVNSGGSAIGTPLSASDALDNGTVTGYTITSIPATGNGMLTYCVTPPSTDCGTTVTAGLNLSPAQAATVSYTPGPNMKTFLIPFTFTATDNSGNVSNVATVMIPVLNATPLPVTLTSFTATATADCSADLQWITASESNLSGYGVEYSTDSRTYKEICKVKSLNNATGSRYSYHFSGMEKGHGLFRLRMEESNGRYQYSNIVKAEASCDQAVYTVSPNPAHNTLQLQGGSSKALQVTIVTTLGQAIKTVELQEGNRSIDVSGLAAGTYIIRVRDAGNLVLTTKIVKL